MKRMKLEVMVFALVALVAAPLVAMAQSFYPDLDPSFFANKEQTEEIRLFKAAYEGDLEQVMSLVKAGADPLAPEEETGMNAAMFAFEGKQLEVAKYLMSKMKDFSDRDKQERTLAMHAAGAGLLEGKMISTLHDRNLLNITDNEGRNVVMYAAQSGSLDTARMAAIWMTKMGSFPSTYLIRTTDHNNKNAMDYVASEEIAEYFNALLKASGYTIP